MIGKTLTEYNRAFMDHLYGAAKEVGLPVGLIGGLTTTSDAVQWMILSGFIYNEPAQDAARKAAAFLKFHIVPIADGMAKLEIDPETKQYHLDPTVVSRAATINH